MPQLGRFVIALLVMAGLARGQGVDMTDLRANNPWVDHPAISPWRTQAYADVYPGPVRPIQDLRDQLTAGIAADAQLIQLEPGIYDGGTEGERWDALLTIKGLENRRVRGTGVVVRLQAQQIGVSIEDCRSTIIEGLTVDSTAAASPFTQGTVTEADRKRLRLTLHAGYPDLAAETGELRKAAIYLADSYLLKPENNTYHGVAYRRIAPRQYELTGRFDDVAVGDYITLIEGHGIHAVTIRGCQDLQLKGTTVHAAGMFATRGIHNDRITYDGVRVTPGPMWPGTDVPRLKSVCQDGINNHESTRVTVLNCLVECHSDDATTLYENMMMPIVAVDGQTLLMRGLRGAARLDAGAPVMTIRHGDMALLDQRTVTAVEPVENDPVHDAVIAKLGRIHRPDRLDRTFRVTLDGPLAAGPGDWIFTPTDGPGIQVIGNRFRNSRGRGVITATRQSRVAYNIIEHSDTHALLSRSEHLWLSPVATDDITIEHNWIRHISFRPLIPKNMKRFAAIQLDAQGGRGYAPPGVHRRLTIAHNTIEDPRQIAIHVSSADGLSITGNRIIRPHHRDMRGVPQDHPLRRVIWVHDSRDVTVADNVLEDVGDAAHAEPILVETQD